MYKHKYIILNIKIFFHFHQPNLSQKNYRNIKKLRQDCFLFRTKTLLISILILLFYYFFKLDFANFMNISKVGWFKLDRFLLL